MIGWTGVLLACLAVFAIKLAGHLAPQRLLERPDVTRAAGLLTAGLLAALVAVQAVATADRLQVDARLPALAVAAIALWWRAPFIVVVALAAITAAGLRALGLP
ncbi:MAG TPA: AzlD domain-containing protein [Kineosporiaceae bacterium]|nr:AzlD domain-containing protein [Kineosporiaceae bacterium]